MAFTTGETIKGWGVVREKPWHFVGIFSTKELAEKKALESGADYVVRFGENQAGTDNFIWSSH